MVKVLTVELTPGEEEGGVREEVGGGGRGSNGGEKMKV